MAVDKSPHDYDQALRVNAEGTGFVLDNGFSVSGESACVNPENYNQQIGEKIAFDNAFRQLWPLFGFLLAEKYKLRAAA